MSGYSVNLETETQENDNFLRVLYTAPHCQLVVITLHVGEDISVKIHRGCDRFICVERRNGEVIFDGEKHVLDASFAVVALAGMQHNIINTSQNAVAYERHR
jgi:mannose-6-phosphate isomerase-like protein (cupin superfamily)